jgi:hypothetical protein
VTEDTKHENHTEEMRNSFNIWIGKVKVKRLFGRPRPRGMTILKYFREPEPGVVGCMK